MENLRADLDYWGRHPSEYESGGGVSERAAYRAGQESGSAATFRLTRRVQNLRDRADAAYEIARATGSATDQAKAEGLALALALMEGKAL